MIFDLERSSSHLQYLRIALLASYKEEDLHQLRITIRRMRTFLRDRPTDEALRLDRKLGKLAKKTNKARDWDTLANSAGDWLAPAQYRELLPLLQGHREAARRPVYKVFHSKLWLTTVKRWDAFATKARLEDAGDESIKSSRLSKRLDRAIAAGRKALKQDSDRRWHRLRIAIKELRYTLEPSAQRNPRASSALLEECRALQALLGDWHDTVVHRQLLDTLLDPRHIDPVAPGAKAADALRRTLATAGQQSLEQIRHKLIRGDLALAAGDIVGHG